MRRETSTALAIALAATAALSTSATLAQSGDDTLWLECRETSRSPGNIYSGWTNRIFSVKSNSIVVYEPLANGDVDRWGDFCNVESATCEINEDEISAEFSLDAHYALKIDRRTGAFELERQHEGGNDSWTAQCSRTTDPRPPAAF